MPSARRERRHASGNSNTLQPERHLERAKPADAPADPFGASFHRTESGRPPRVSSADRPHSPFHRTESAHNFFASIDLVPRPSAAGAPFSGNGRSPTATVAKIPGSLSNATLTRTPSTLNPALGRAMQQAGQPLLAQPKPSDQAPHRPMTAAPHTRPVSRTSRSAKGWKADPDPRFPWRDPQRQLTSSTEWHDGIDGTKVRPTPATPQHPESMKVMSPSPGEFLTTRRGKTAGGFMDSRSHPSSALDLSRPGNMTVDVGGLGTNCTRPPFETMVPKPPKEESEPPSIETLQKIRSKVYEKAVSLKDCFRHFDADKDGTVSRAEFKKALKDMNLDFPAKTVNGILDTLDADGNDVIEYQEFASLLQAKDTMGEYNSFLLERTYYDGATVPEETHKERSKKITAKHIDAAYKLHDKISKRFYLRYRNPREMFRDVDENHNGAISSEEFVDKLKKLAIETTTDEIDNMLNVFRMSQPGQLTYTDFVEYFQQPDKWGFGAQFNPVLRLGKNGENNTHPPMDSTTMQKTHWHVQDKQGRPEPRDLLKRKKEMLKDFVREKKTIQPSVTEPTIVLKGKTSKGLLDRFLMQEIRRKFSQMKSNMRDMFHILDPANEGRISRDNFHKCMKSMNMGIPEPVLDELISFVDTDNCGYVEMPEFVELMNPLNDENLPRHDEEEISEISRLLSEPPGSGGIPASELHPLVKDYLQDNVLRPSMIEMIKDSIDRKSKNLRRIFLNWDHDQDGFIDATEMRKGLASLNLGIPEGVIARIVERLDTDGNGKLDFQEFTAAFQKPNHLGSTNQRSEPINNNHGSAEIFVTTALGRHSVGGGQPPAGCVKGNGAKNLNMNLMKVGYYDASGARPSTATSSITAASHHSAISTSAGVRRHTTAKGEILFYGHRSSTPFLEDGLIEARQPWKQTARDDLRSSWQQRTEAKRHRVQSAHSTRRSVSSLV